VPFLVSWRTGGAKATKRRRRRRVNVSGEQFLGGALSRKASKQATIPSTSTDRILATPSAPPVLPRPARAQSTAEQPARAAARDEPGAEEGAPGAAAEGTVSQRTTETLRALESSATRRGSAEGLTTALTA